MYVMPPLRFLCVGGCWDQKRQTKPEVKSPEVNSPVSLFHALLSPTCLAGAVRGVVLLLLVTTTHREIITLRDISRVLIGVLYSSLSQIPRRAVAKFLVPAWGDKVHLWHRVVVLAR